MKQLQRSRNADWKVPSNKVAEGDEKGNDTTVLPAEQHRRVEKKHRNHKRKFKEHVRWNAARYCSIAMHARRQQSAGDKPVEEADWYCLRQIW